MAATASTLTSISALLKQHYLKPDVIQNVMIDFGPLTAKLLSEAATDCSGLNVPFPLIYSGGGGVGSSMAAAYASATPAASKNFLMTRATSFGQILLGGEALKASENLDGAFIADLALEVDTKEKRLREYLAAMVYGDGTGAMAQMANSSFATGVIALTDPPLAARFQVGDAINIGTTTAGAGVLTTSGSTFGSGTIGIGFVIAVDIPNGRVTVSSTPGGSATNLSSIWGGTGSNALAQDAFIYFNGDQLLVSSGSGVPSNSAGQGSAIPSGLLSWLPVGGPASSGDSFFGVNRYGNSALYGQVIDATAAGLNLGTIRAALSNAVAQLRQVGSKPKECYMHPLAFNRLSIELQSQGMYPGKSGEGPSGEGSFGFSSLVLPTDVGDVKVIADPQCMPCLTASGFTPSSSGYSGAMTAFLVDDNWEAISMGDIPFLDESDGNYFLRIQGTDTYQIQCKAYWNVGTHRPNGSCAVLLPQ